MTRSSFRNHMSWASIAHLLAAALVTAFTILALRELEAGRLETLAKMLPILAVAITLAMAAGYLATFTVRRAASELARKTGLSAGQHSVVRTGTGISDFEAILRQCDWAAEMFRGAVDRSPVGLIVSDTSGCVVYANHFAGSLLGREPGQIPGADLSVLLNGATAGFPMLDRESGETVLTEVDLARPDGSTVAVGLTLWPVFGREGQPFGKCCLIRDLSSERRRKLEWLAGERAFRYLRDEIEIYVVDDKGRIIWTNKTAGLAGVDFLEHFCGGNKLTPDGAYTSKIIEVLETGKTYSDQIVTSNDGQNVHRLTIKRLFDDSGRVIGCVSLSFDVTQEFRLKEQVRRSERLGTIGELASTTAHELRNPLTAMRATAQLGLLAENLPETKEYFELIIGEIDRLSQFISELVMLSKPEGEPLVAMSLNDLCEQVLTLVHGKVLIGNVKVTTGLTYGVPLILGSRRLLKQALLNLITNAIQAMPTGGQLGVVTRAAPDGRFVEVVVSDTGVGMPPETMKKLFQPFFTTKESGTGIGLAVTHQIVVDLHRGEITFDSSPGRGTSVTLRLPVAEEGRDQAAAGTA